MSKHINPQPKSREELDAWLKEAEEELRAVQIRAINKQRAQPEQSASQQNPALDSHKDAEAPATGKPKRKNPAYVRSATEDDNGVGQEPGANAENGEAASRVALNAAKPEKDPAQIFNNVFQEYGEPRFPTERNPVGSLNEPFWAALYRSEHHILFEPNEHAFYEFSRDIYRLVTGHLILDRLGNRLREIATDGGYPFLNQLTGTRHLI
jgi:hypothetical protein